MNRTAPEHRTGALRYIGERPLGLDRYRWSECIDCHSLYPHIDGRVSCNGRAITLCPWCRPDSRTWQAGRGR